MAIGSPQWMYNSGSAAYEIDQSLRFEDGSGAYLSRTPASASNRKTWTWSGWVKRGNLGTYQTIFAVDNSSTEIAECYWDGSDNSILWHLGGGSNYRFYTNAVYRDSSSWYHIICSLDTTISSPSGNDTRMKLYVNGEQVTSFRSNATPSLNYEGLVNLNTQHEIGEKNGTNNPLDGYLAEVHFIDGLAKVPADFGETGDYGEWKPIEYSGSYGTNGFYLDFSNSGALGTDSSGNSNTWTVNNLAATDQMLDSPTNNFATVSLIASTATKGTHTNVVYSEGNLKLRSANTAVNGWKVPFRMTGKCYFEVCMLNLGYPVIGFGDWDWDGASGIIDGIAALNFYPNNGAENISYSAGSTQTGIGPDAFSIADGGIIGFAYDEATGKAWASINGTWYGSGNPATGANPIVTFNADKRNDIYPAGTVYDSGGYIVLNFGQDSSFAGAKTAQGNQDGNSIGDFYYAPPTGFLALCTKNLPDVAVIPSEHFNTVLYTGNGGTQNITGVGFQPDWVWFKARSFVENHALYDSVRGATKDLRSDVTNAENTNATGLTAFGSDGFSIGSVAYVNQNAATYASWNWKANGSGSSNTNGSTNSTVSVNTDAGFSIVSYTGASGAQTIGHGLSKAPEMIIVKDRSSAQEWLVYHASNTAAPETDYLRLDTTAATADNTFWNDTAPTSSVFSVGDSQPVNSGHGDSYIAYAFHSVDGYSKVGSYTGNGNADGTFVYTGFRPAYVMWKKTNAAGTMWQIMDTTRDPFNVMDLYLQANSSNAEGDYDFVDYTSNGFKHRHTSGHANGSGDTYIYIAFAETPFKHSNAR